MLYSVDFFIVLYEFGAFILSVITVRSLIAVKSELDIFEIECTGMHF